MISAPTTVTNTRSFASLRILGFSLDFEEIARILQVRPSKTHRAGELDTYGTPYLSDLWLLDTSHTATIGADLKWLQETLAPHYQFLHGLKERAQVRSYCGFTADDRGSFRVLADGLSLFTELDIDLEIGLVFLGSADSRSNAEQFAPTEKTEVEAAEPPAYRTSSKAALQVMGLGLDLGGISAELGFEPSEAHRSGETCPTGERYSTDLWSLVAPLPGRDTLDMHLKWLGMALRRHSDFLRSLAHEADLLIRCQFGTESDSGGVSVSPEGLKVCTQLEIPLEFDAFLAGAQR